MPDYANAKLYAIRSHQTDKVYIGATCNALNVRMAQHRSHHKANSNITACIMLEYSDAYIELIETFPCKTKEELNKREGELIRSHFHAVNKAIAGRTRKESNKAYYDANKEKHRIYREQAKEV
jgi:CRISPR/Cas system-associated endonuclease Cas1